MTLMKSLLLGSAAGIVAVASAQAADLPTRKGAPAAEYVRICSITVNGKAIVGWTLPGSDTCFKLSGYVTAQIEGGNRKDGEVLEYAPGGIAAPGVQIRTPTLGGGATSSNGGNSGGSNARPEFGFSTRLNVTGEFVTNTAYGPLYATFQLQSESSNGFDTLSNSTYINVAYLTWAGITAGKAPSFFSFTGGGAGYANFFSPDEQGFNQPDLLAYTASFGGGFSASAAIQSVGGVPNGGGTNSNFISGNNWNAFSQGVDYQYNGTQFPDFVANVKVSQGWGSAMIGGVAHRVDVTGFSGAIQRTWGFAVDAGISFNLPQIGPGDDIFFTGAYSEHAAWYSGLPDGMWGENGAVNGNGQQMALADTYLNNDGVTFAKPKMWSVTGEFDHHIGTEWTFSPEASYGEVHWDGTNATSVVSNSKSWLAGAVAHWDPLKNSSLDFELELLYQETHTDQPNLFLGPLPWQGKSDGFAARFQITRNW
jgi:hypothetical protein